MYTFKRIKQCIFVHNISEAVAECYQSFITVAILLSLKLKKQSQVIKMNSFLSIRTAKVTKQLSWLVGWL